MILCIILWIPQIIYNIRSNNKYIYPFIFILSSTIDKLIYPFYFRGIKNNFLGSKDNLILLLIMTSFVIFTIVIMYMQVLKGPRFMLSINLNQSQSEYNFYKSKEELNLIRNNIGTEECVICLLPIFEEDNGDDDGNNDDTIIEMEDKTEVKDIENLEEKIDVKDIDESKEEINLSYNDTNNSSDSSINSELEKIEDNENNIQIIPIISNHINVNLNENNKDNKKSHSYHSHLTNKIRIKLVEEEIEENKIKNNIKYNKFCYKDKFLLIMFKLKTVLNNIIYIFKILFYENFFWFYKKKINTQGKEYMYTPCNHVFHSECLEKWLEYKKECPNCRASMEEYL